MAVFTGRGHLCNLSRKAPPGAVVAGPTGRCRSTMTALTGGAGSFKLNNRAGDSEFAIVFGCFSRIKKLLGRTETRTRDRMCFQSIRTV